VGTPSDDFLALVNNGAIGHLVHCLMNRPCEDEALTSPRVAFAAFILYTLLPGGAYY